MRLTMPLPPNIANGRMHWRTKQRAKEAYYKRADDWQLVGRIPRPPEKPYARVSLSVHLYTHNAMDHDNGWARLKWVADWLVTRGYIVDDGPAHVEYAALAQSVDRSDKRVEIEMEVTR